MSAFWALFRRDIALAFRQGGSAGLALGFFVIVVALVPLGLGPDLNLLGRIAPGLLWVTLLLASLLTLDRLFHADHEDGSLDLIALGPLALELAVLAKVLAHWLTTALPLAVAAPLIGILLNLDAAAIGPLALTMLVGSPGLSFVGAIGAALTIGVRRGGLLAAILVLPLFVPTLVFGVSAVAAAITGPASFGPPFLILAALSLAALALAPFAAAAAIRFNLG